MIVSAKFCVAGKFYGFLFRRMQTLRAKRKDWSRLYYRIRN